MAPSPAIAGASAASAFFSNANGKPRSLRRTDLTVGTDRKLPEPAPLAVYSSAVAPDTAYGDGVHILLALALTDPSQAKARFPDFRLTRLVTARLDMDDEEATLFSDLANTIASQPLSYDPAQFDEHLRAVIGRIGLTPLFRDDGPGRHHHAVRPSGCDYKADKVDAWGMERWRADCRAMSTARQMVAASIIWLYRGGKDSRWLRRVPCTWHAVDALCEMRRSGVLPEWGRLISLYPGW
jgi:hypothetical protein